MLAYLLFITAFSMEAIGSYVSIVGLSSLFAGDPVIIGMTLCLDVAKIMSVSFIYQYWTKLNFAMKYYMLAAVIVLMTITSSGAFGYLSGSFQKAMQPNMEVMLKIDSYKREQETLTLEKTRLVEEKSKIDQQIAQLPTNSIKGRRQLIASFKPDQDRIADRTIIVTKRIDELTGEILKAESSNIEQTVHVGPIMYVSKAFDISVEDASKWIILVIISVFDPLAIMMIVAGNFLIVLKRSTKLVPEKLEEVHHEQMFAPIPELQLENLEPAQSSAPERPTVDDSDLGEVVYVPVSELKKEFPIVPWTDDVVAEDSVDPEILDLTDKVYYSSHWDTEEISDVEESTELLQQKIQSYVPTDPEVVPKIEVEPQSRYSGPPQTEFIDQPVSSIEQLNIRIPQALVKEGVITESKKRHLYE